MDPVWKTELRATLQLAAPVIIAQVGMMMMGVVDIAMVGHLSKQALAAVALGNVCVFALMLFCMGILQALDPLVSQAVGARDPASIGANVQRGMLLALLLSIPACCLALSIESLLVLLDQPRDVIPMAGGYVLAAVPGILPFLVFVLLRQTLQAMSQTGAILATVLVANAANLVLDWMLIYGELGAPQLGTTGCAWATTACRYLLAAGLLALGWRHLGIHLWPLRPEVLQLRPLWRMVKLGAPIGFAFMLEHGAFMATLFFMGQFGEDELSGHQIAITLASLSFMVPLGLSSAGTVRVGYAVGRGDRAGATRAAVTVLLLAAACMTAFMFPFLGLPRGLAALCTNQGEVVAMAAALIPVAGVFQVFDGLQVVAAGVLRGLGDTRTAMLVHLVGFWVLGIPIGLGLAHRWGVGAPGLWWGLVIGLGSAAITLVLIVRVRLRAGVERVRIDDAA